MDNNDYYPLGLNHKLPSVSLYDPIAIPYNYKFGSKELQETGFYDFGARNYMPDVGRWFNSDPMAELSPNLTPYRYAFNNPVLFTDPDGMYEGESGGEGDYYDDSDRGNDFAGSFDVNFHWSGESRSYGESSDLWDIIRGAWGVDIDIRSGTQNGNEAENDAMSDMMQENVSNDMIDDDGPGPKKSYLKPIAPLHVNNYDGVTGKLLYLLNGGNPGNGGKYNMDGELLGPAAVQLIVPDIGKGAALKGFKSALSLFKGGSLTNAGRAVTKHPQYFGFESTEALMKVFRNPSAINKLGAATIKDILRNGVKTTGSGGRYPQGWITYTLSNGNAASWTVDGVFIGFRGLK